MRRWLRLDKLVLRVCANTPFSIDIVSLPLAIKPCNTSASSRHDKILSDSPIPHSPLLSKKTQIDLDAGCYTHIRVGPTNDSIIDRFSRPVALRPPDEQAPCHQIGFEKAFEVSQREAPKIIQVRHI